MHFGTRAFVTAALLGTFGWFLLAGPASAQIDLPDRGTVEYSLNGTIHLSAPGAQLINVGYKPFLNPNWQWGVEFGYRHVRGGDSIGSIAGVLNYYFRTAGTGRTLPYAGIILGTTFGDSSDFAYGAQGGVKHFITSNVALTAELQWRHNEDASPRNPVDIVLGFSFFK